MSGLLCQIGFAPLESCRRFASVFSQTERPVFRASLQGMDMERVGKVVDFLVVSVSILMVVTGLASLLRF